MGICFRWTVVISCLLISLLTLAPIIQGVSRRCWTCRSRGEYGDCKDPFSATSNNLDRFPGATMTPCASGWCAKVVESNDEELSVATERLCLPRPPEDNQERCAETHWERRLVYMCFCPGDLCNGASIPSGITLLYMTVAGLTVYWNLRR